MLDPRLLWLAALAVVTALLLRRTYRRLGRRRKAEPALARVPRPASERRQLSDAPPEIARYEVQLHETARELTAVLDSKMVALNCLIAQAQAKIDRLESLLDQQRPNAPPEPQPAPALEGEHAEVFALAAEGFSAATIAHRTHTPLAEVQKLLAERSTT